MDISLNLYYFEPGVERSPSTRQNTHCLNCTLITAFFILISLDNSMCHPACNGLYLFMLIVKFRIRNSIHSLSYSWNSSSDAKMGSTCTILVNRIKELVLISNSFSYWHFYLYVYHWYKFTIKHDVDFNIVMILHNNCHMLKSNFSRVFKKLTRFDVFKIYYPGQYIAFKRGVYFVPSESRAVSDTHLYETFTHRVL